MDEIKTIKPSEEPSQSAPEEIRKSDTKGILLALGIIVGIFALVLVGGKIYTGLTGSTVIDVDDLHQENLQGDLDEDQGYVYNGFSLVKADGLWWTEIVKYGDTLLKIPLHFGPKDLENITFEGSLSPSFNLQPDIYVAIDPTVSDKYYGLALSELNFNIVKGVDRRPIGACTKEDSACENRTIISCAQVEGRAVVELALAKETSIELSGTCIKISAQKENLVRAVDRLLYKWYGVMP